MVPKSQSITDPDERWVLCTHQGICIRIQRIYRYQKMMKKYIGFLISLVLTVSLAVFAHLYLHHKKHKNTQRENNVLMDTVEAIDYRFNDLKYKLHNIQKTQAPVVLLAVDDESVQEVGRWPWSRDLMADILQKLMDYGASAVGLDVIFSEPEKAFPENDKKLADVVKRHTDKIILGTYSNNELHVLPYQDICVTEAFLRTGGDRIVKINASLVVNDDRDTFDDVAWEKLFDPVFATITNKVRTNYLADHQKKDEASLTGFQKNHLKAKTQAAWFAYCSQWLTEKDLYFTENKAQLLNVYRDIFAQKWTQLGVDTSAKIEMFKNFLKTHPTPQYGQWVPNILELQEPAQLSASFVLQPDVDGTIRKYPLFYRSGNRLGTSYIPSLALQMYLVTSGYRSEVTISEKQGQQEISEFQVIDAQKEADVLMQKFPVDNQGRLQIKYYGPQSTLPYVSAKDLLNEDSHVTVYQRVPVAAKGIVVLSKNKIDKKEFFKNRAVLLGATSLGIYDMRNTPVETNYPGPEIHLTVLANMLDKNYLKSMSREEIQLPLAIFVIGFFIGLLLIPFGAMSSAASFFVCSGVAAVIDYFVFTKIGLSYSSVLIVVVIVVVHATMIVYKYLSEEKKKQELKRTFSKYVSPAVVDEILKTEENLKLGGKKQEMSVFFSDVRGFTKFSEKMDPEELAQFLNEYLTPMTEVIFNNKGTLDKYMGDGLMAFFGAPIPNTDHASCACKAALESLQKLKILKEEFKRKKWPDIDIGIGINTGLMSVGNMGSQIVQSYTVIGDAVNLGARLEGTTKQYGVRILVSEFTYNAAKEHYIFREVDRVRVVGKKDPVGAFELLDDKKNVLLLEYVDKYNRAYLLYTQKDFVKAKDLFTDLEKHNPQDKLVSIYKTRCEEFILEPPSSDWDGVFEMKTK